jgi:hypothetical protein
VLDGFTLINSPDGAIYINGGNRTRILNCVIRDNIHVPSQYQPISYQGDGAAIIAARGAVDILNCTIFRNTPLSASEGSSSNGANIFVSGNAVVNLINAIIQDDFEGIQLTSNGAVTVTNCDIKGSTVYPGVGNINADPKLYPDGHLTANSPCIGSGAPVESRLDMDHEARPQANNRYDIGADQYLDTNGNGMPD